MKKYNKLWVACVEESTSICAFNWSQKQLDLDAFCDCSEIAEQLFCEAVWE